MRPKKPSWVHEVEVAVGVTLGLVVWRVFAGGSSPSRQPPNQPGYLQEEVEVGAREVVVAMDDGAAVLECLEVVVVSSRHPNQPGVLQVDVVEEETVLVVLLCPLVVVSSRQPNQPGVLHVSVLVRDDRVVVVLVGFGEVVVVSVPLLSKYSHV